MVDGESRVARQAPLELQFGQEAGVCASLQTVGECSYRTFPGVL